MGCDYLYCKRCRESHRYDYFLGCDICSNSLEFCIDCYDDKNKFADKKVIPEYEHDRNIGLIICDDCIEHYEKDDINNIQNIKLYKITKKQLDKNINKVKHSYFSKDAKIERVDDEIKQLEEKIKELRKYGDKILFQH